MMTHEASHLKIYVFLPSQGLATIIQEFETDHPRAVSPPVLHYLILYIW